jgi:hypothetical protein
MFKITIIEERMEGDMELYSQRIETIDLPKIQKVINAKKRVRKSKEEKET